MICALPALPFQLILPPELFQRINPALVQDLSQSALIELIANTKDHSPNEIHSHNLSTQFKGRSSAPKARMGSSRCGPGASVLEASCDFAEAKRAMILNRLIDLFKKTPEQPGSEDSDSAEAIPPEASGPPDVDTGAEASVRDDQERILSELGQSARSAASGPFTAFLIGAGLALSALGFAAGRFTGGGSCTVNRPGVLVMRDGQQFTGILASLDGAGAFFRKGEGNTNDRFLFDTISRIIFFRDQQEQQLQAADSLALAGALGSFPGVYDMESGGHKGELSIFFTPAGLLNGSVRFTNWGTRQPEGLNAMRVVGNRIDFRRACAGLECRRIGSPYDFHQDYTGYVDMARKEIKGTYSGDHSSGTWLARRRQ